MTKTKTDLPVWDRLSKNARMGSDRKRGLYVAARRLAAPARATVRTVEAHRASPDGFAIPSDRGFAVFGPDRFPESREIVEAATRRFGGIDPDAMREKGKPFMVPILDQATLTRDSPFVRFALRPDVLRAVFSQPPANTRNEVVASAVQGARIVGSTGFAIDEEEIAERAALAFERGHDLLGAARQGLATLASGDRTERLRTLNVPTLVIHGLADRMCDPSGGRATASPTTSISHRLRIERPSIARQTRSNCNSTVHRWTPPAASW